MVLFMIQFDIGLTYAALGGGLAVIDLHCHILPGLDDGAESLEIAMDMALLAWQNGTDVIAATAHCCRPDQEGVLSLRRYAEKLQLLHDALRSMNCPLRLVTGMEVFATPELPELLRRKQLISLANTRYMLLEFYFDEDPAFMEYSFHSLMEQGYTPVVAHPERYDAVQRDPELVADWFDLGYIIQLNKGTILGRLGGGAQRTAWWLLRRGLAHVVASDAHTAVRRNPNLASVRDSIGQEISWTYAELLLEENPRRILNGEDMVPLEDF